MTLIQNSLRNHREDIAAMDFFVVPTATFRVLYVLFVIHHGRRQIVHFAVTENAKITWVARQLREAFPFEQAPRHLIFDRDAKFSGEVVHTIETVGIKRAILCIITRIARTWISTRTRRCLFSRSMS
jgi:hypothetical protein